jgi:glycosyltransferase involved in cell wall biosynthesis
VKLAIVHDYLNQMGGAERVLKVLHEVYPDAPIYTSIYEPSLVDPAFMGMDIRTTFMQRLPFVARHHRPFLPVFPLAFESLDLRQYDVVLSVSSAWSKSVLTRPETCHVCYCLSPMRFAWSFLDYAPGEVNRWQGSLLLPILMALRAWDVASAARVDHFIGISSHVARRILKYYRRQAAVIYPPVETRSFAAEAANAGDDGYFLIVARLIPYKRIDLAIEACNRIGAKLKIIGNGRDRTRLEALAGQGGNVEFLGHVEESEKRRYLRRCRAFIFPNSEEDFGIAPVEALASGRPLVAYAAGGALDMIEEGMNGLFVRGQTVEALADVLARVPNYSWDSRAISEHASKFDVETFKSTLQAFVTEKVAEHLRPALGAGAHFGQSQPALPST